MSYCDFVDCSPPGCSVQGIFQARILEWVAISFSIGLTYLSLKQITHVYLKPMIFAHIWGYWVICLLYFSPDSHHKSINEVTLVLKFVFLNYGQVCIINLYFPQDWKRSVFIPIPKKDNAKNVQTTSQLCSSHMLAK